MGHLLAHESEGSILAFLIKEGLASELSGGSSDHSDYYTYFNFTIYLTEKGYVEYERVCEVVGAYVKMLEKVGPQKWVFDEVKQMQEVGFLYKNQIGGWDMADDLSSELLNTEIPRILEYDSCMDNFDPENLKEYLSHMKPENTLVTLISQKNQGLTDQVEPIYQIHYSVTDLTDSHKASFANPTLAWATTPNTINDIHLPQKNEFIPKNFEIIHKGPKLAYQNPKKIHSDAKMTVWHLLDGQFLLPKVSMRILLKPITWNIDSDPKTALMAELWVDELLDFLRDFAYMA
jgi:insulysin